MTMNTNYCMNEYVCSGIILQDPESKKEIGSFNNIQEINMTRNTIEQCHDYRGYKSIITKDERVLSFSADTSRFNLEALVPNQVSILATKKVQARKHRKKRINKKWLKRYGYKEQNVDLGKWNYKQTDKFGEYKFERKIV